VGKRGLEPGGVYIARERERKIEVDIEKGVPQLLESSLDVSHTHYCKMIE